MFLWKNCNEIKCTIKTNIIFLIYNINDRAQLNKKWIGTINEIIGHR